MYFGDVVVKPCSAQCSSRASVVSIIVARHVLQNNMHFIRRDFGE